MRSKAMVWVILVIFLALLLAVSGFGTTNSHNVLADDGCEETELSFDNDQLFTGWLCGGQYCGGVVRFTPPTAPWTISKVKVIAWIGLGDAPFWIEIWDGDCSELFHGEYMYSDYFTSSPTWVIIEIPYTVVQGDFYVGFFGNWSESHKLWLGFDTGDPVSYRSFVADCDDNSIAYGNEWNWMIRAVGCSPPYEVWVDDDFTAATPGWGITHFDKIQDGIDAVAGSIVHVGPGYYTENIILKGGVRLEGAGAKLTTIDGGAKGPVVRGVDCGAGTSIEEFTITNGTNTGYQSCGGGISVSHSYLTISNNIIVGNRAYSGGGIGVWAYSTNIINNIIAYNHATDPNASEHYGGGGMYLGSLETGTLVTNNTIVANTAAGVGGILCDGFFGVFQNNIIWDNGLNLSGCTPTYCNIEESVPGEGNISADPMFLYPAGGDYHLRAGSPCIDAGTNEGAPTEDIEGNPRPIDGDGDCTAITDMGAYEYVPPPNRPPVADAGPDQTVYVTPPATTNEVTLDGSGSHDPDGNPLTYTWTWDGNTAHGVNPTVELPLGTAIITLVVNDCEVSDSDTVDVTVAVSFFDPWDYDLDEDGVISKMEALTAVVDYFGGLITKQQALAVIVLYFD